MPKQKSTHVDSPEATGRRLHEARVRAGVSQRELSFSGCTAAYISRIESGQRIPSLQLLRELGRRLGVSAEYLATGDDEEQRDRLLEAELALRFDEVEAAERLFHQELQQPLDRVRRGRALGGLGQLAYRAGQIELAIERLRDAVDLVGEAIVDYPTIAIILGAAHISRGDRESSVELFEAARQLATKRQDTSSETRFSVYLADALIDRGDLGRAAELLDHAIGLSQAVHEPGDLSRLYWSQSRLHVIERSFDLAAMYGQRALALIDMSEGRLTAAHAHRLLASVELERGNGADALEILEQGFPLIVDAGDRFELALFKLEQARAMVQLGRIPEARELALDSLAELETERRVDAARGFIMVADVLVASDERERAIEIYEANLERMGTSPDAVEAYQRLADLLEIEGRTEDAFAVLKKAVALQSAQVSRAPAS